MPFDRGQCQIPYPSPGPKGWGFQLTGALPSVWKMECRFLSRVEGNMSRVEVEGQGRG